jgi:hypothetical protein
LDYVPRVRSTGGALLAVDSAPRYLKCHRHGYFRLPAPLIRSGCTLFRESRRPSCNFLHLS